MSEEVVGAVAARPADDTTAGKTETETEQKTQTPHDAVTASPPKQADLLIRLNDDPALGFCVYALRPYRRGERLFQERTALEATHDAHPEGIRNVYERYCQMNDDRRRALHGSFPHLAWANGVDAQEAAAARTLVGSLLTPASRGLVIDNRLTAEDHMSMRPDRGVPGGEPVKKDKKEMKEMKEKKEKKEKKESGVAAPALRAKAAIRGLFTRSSSTATLADLTDEEIAEKRARTETLDWFSRYAFRLKPEASFAKRGGNHQAAVYLLTDLINHRCGGFQNCRVAADVGTITVLALRDIAAGEEVTINYSKDVKDFQCKGECCVKK